MNGKAMNKATKEQNEIFQSSSDKLSKLILSILEEYDYEEEVDYYSIDPIITAAIGVSSEFAYHLGYDRGEILDKVVSSLDQAMKQKNKLLMKNEQEELIIDQEGKDVKWIN